MITITRMDPQEFVTELLNAKREVCKSCGHQFDHIEEHDALLHYAPCDYCDGNHATCSHRD